MAGKPGRSGKRPTPVRILKMRGTYRADRHGGRCENPVPGLMEAPCWLCGEGLILWHKLTTLLRVMGLESPLFEIALAMTCQSYADFVSATNELKTAKHVLSNKGGRKYPNPLIRIRQTAWDQFRAGLAGFGLTPADVQRLRPAVSPAADETKTKFFLKK
jgi:P27 family predicted phage terminase small subunit